MSRVDRMSFFGYLSTMLVAGIPLARGLVSIQEQFGDPRARGVVKALRVRLLTGEPLSGAMAALPSTFSHMEVHAIRAGERAGRLPQVLARLSAYEERTLAMSRRVQSLLVYPLVVFVAALLLVVALTEVLLSALVPVLVQAKMQMNPATAAVVAAVRILGHPIGVSLILASIAAGVILGRRWLETTAGAETRDRLLMRIPFLGVLLQKIEMTRIAESLSTLHDSGLPLDQCLEAASDACTNVVAREALWRVASEVRAGEAISTSMAAAGFFSRTVVQMLRVGEDSGRLDVMLGKIAQYNDLDVHSALEQFASAVEPVMIVGLGLVVTIIVLVAFAPLYQLISTLG